jgi:hypothetical protein
MTDRTSFLVPISGMEEAFRDLPQIVGYEQGHQWAKLDPDSFAKVMKYVYDNRAIAGMVSLSDVTISRNGTARERAHCREVFKGGCGKASRKQS